MDTTPEERRTCPNCGTPVTESNIFCPVCGTDLRATAADPEIKPEDQPTVPNLPTAEPPPETPLFEPFAASDAAPTGEPAPPPEPLNEPPAGPPPRTEPSWISPTPPGDYEALSRLSTEPESTGSGGNSRVWWIVGIIVVLFFLACCCLAVILIAVASTDSALHDELNTATAGLVALVPSIAK